MSDVIVGSLLILSGFALLIFARWLIDAINEDHAKKYSCTFNPETEEFETTNHKEERTMSEKCCGYIHKIKTMRETVLDELIDKAGAESGESSSGYEAEMAWKWLTQERAALESDK